MSKAFDRFKSAYESGQFIYRDGDLGSEMYIVQSGIVDLVKDVNGEEQTIASLEKGDFFGELTVLENLPRNTSARANQDCEVIAINGMTFDKMIKSNIEIAVRMLRKFSNRMRDSDAEALRLLAYSNELEQKIAGLEAGGAGPVAEPAAKAPPAIVQPPAAVPPPAQAPPAVAVPPPAVAVPPPAVAAPPASPPPVAAPSGALARPIMIVKGSGKRHVATSDEVTIGRADPVTGLRPDIDLTNEDVNRFISRRHARILFKDGTYYLVEEVGVTNGTYLNGKRLQAGVYTPIASGDELCFGKVFLSFEIPSS